MAELPIYKISFPEAKILADLDSLGNDLKILMEMLLRLLEGGDDDITKSAFFSSGLIIYRRCFNSGVRNGLTRADVEALPNNAIELHDYLYNQANRLVAHSVNPFEQTTVGIVVAEEKAVGVATLHTRLVNFDREGINQWGSLVKLIGNTVINPRIDAARAAVKAKADAMPISEIIAGGLCSYAPPGPDAAGKPRA